jgi:predicted molibdopterin-dependent oxidoreductase YjgC
MKLYVKDGKLVKVVGDEDHPINQGRLCIRCLSLPDYIYHKDRVIHPLKRVGERGSNQWERISGMKLMIRSPKNQRNYRQIRTGIRHGLYRHRHRRRSK